MKKPGINKFHLLVFLLSGWIGTNAQTTLESEVPGDNFSLEGALSLFKKSASPEEFEKILNSADSKVNNLDLNGDGNIDYIRVIDRNEGNVHIFILQAIISENESQDVAVIELEKLDNGKAVLQITGDADVYGTETIIEPTEEVRVNAGTTTTRTVVNVWTWPSVQYVYAPYYSGWVSPWRWSYYPFWWRPWRPVAFYVYDPWWRPYRSYYSVCHSHRIGYLPRYYRPYRSTSVIVYNNHRNQIDRYRSSNGNRNRYDGRTADGRDRNDNGRYRSDNSGYRNDNNRDRNNNNRERSYNNGSNHESGQRYDAKSSTSSNRLQYGGGSDNSTSGNKTNGYTLPEKTTSGRTNNRSFSGVKDHSGGKQQSTELRRQAPEQKRTYQIRENRSNPTVKPGNRQQSSGSPSFKSSGSPSNNRAPGRSSPSFGEKGNKSIGGGNNGGRTSQRGRH